MNSLIKVCIFKITVEEIGSYSQTGPNKITIKVDYGYVF